MKKLILGERSSLAVLFDTDAQSVTEYKSSYQRIDYMYLAKEDMTVCICDKEFEAKSGDIILVLYPIVGDEREVIILNAPAYHDYLDRYDKEQNDRCLSKSKCQIDSDCVTCCESPRY